MSSNKNEVVRINDDYFKYIFKNIHTTMKRENLKITTVKNEFIHSTLKSKLEKHRNKTMPLSLALKISKDLTNNILSNIKKNNLFELDIKTNYNPHNSDENQLIHIPIDVSNTGSTSEPTPIVESTPTPVSSVISVVNQIPQNPYDSASQASDNVVNYINNYNTIYITLDSKSRRTPINNSIFKWEYTTSSTNSDMSGIVQGDIDLINIVSIRIKNFSLRLNDEMKYNNTFNRLGVGILEIPEAVVSNASTLKKHWTMISDENNNFDFDRREFTIAEPSDKFRLSNIYTQQLSTISLIFTNPIDQITFDADRSKANFSNFVDDGNDNITAHIQTDIAHNLLVGDSVNINNLSLTEINTFGDSKIVANVSGLNNNNYQISELISSTEFKIYLGKSVTLTDGEPELYIKWSTGVSGFYTITCNAPDDFNDYFNVGDDILIYDKFITDTDLTFKVTEIVDGQTMTLDGTLPAGSSDGDGAWNVTPKNDITNTYYFNLYFNNKRFLVDLEFECLKNNSN